VQIRATTGADLPVLEAPFREAIADVYLSPGLGPLSHRSMSSHLLEGGGGLCRVAEDHEGAAGFASAWLRGDDWFPASLFVAP
jgi:hypothetical protein